MRRNLLVGFGAAIVLLVSGRVMASTATTASAGSNGYNVFPLLSSLVINDGTTKEITLYVQNISHDDEQVQSIVDNFISSPSDNGTPELLLNGGTSSHGLKQFISIKGGQFMLTPGQQKAVNVDITIPSGTESGGYYGAVRFAPQTVSRSSNLNLSGSVASLILVTVPGNLNEELNIVKFGAGGPGGSTHELFTSNKDINGVVYFSNNGNVQVQPFGYFDVHDGSHDLGNNVVNRYGGYVLPGGERYFTTKLKGIGTFGKYTIYGNFGYGNHGQLLSAEATFYVIPSWLMWTVLGIFLAILFYLITYFRFMRHRRPKRL